MVNKELLGGLRIAIEKGESLKRAMNTLFNAGYKKEEIEEAAKSLSEPANEQGERALNPIITEPVQKISPSKPRKNLFKKLSSPMEKPVQKISSAVSKTPSVQQQIQPVTQTQIQSAQPQVVQPVIIQRVSGYEEPQTIKEKIIIAVLITLLVILLGALAAIFLFQQQLINFFSTIFNASA